MTTSTTSQQMKSYCDQLDAHLGEDGKFGPRNVRDLIGFVRELIRRLDCQEEMHRILMIARDGEIDRLMMKQE